MKHSHCVKSVQIQSFFRSVFSCIRTEYKKIRTRKNSVLGHFLRSVSLFHQYSSLLVGSVPSVLSITVMLQSSKKPLWSFEEKCSNQVAAYFPPFFLLRDYFLCKCFSFHLSLNVSVMKSTYCKPHTLQESK